jgi:cell division septation protein DedD
MNKKALRLSLAALVGLFVFASALGAASTWEGSAVIGGLEDFPSDDLFGACNSFPVNSSVEVENLENGKKVSVVISQTIDNPAVFMALSPKAAATLGMRRGAASRVRILAAPAVSTSAPRPAVAPGASVDPDYTPSVLAYAKPSAEKGDSSKGAELSGLLGPSSKGGAGASADIAAVASPEEEPPVAALPEARAPEAPALVEPAPAVTAEAPETAAPAAEAAAVETPAAEVKEPAELAAAEPEAEAAEEPVPPESVAAAVQPEAPAETPTEPVVAAEAAESAETAESAESAETAETAAPAPGEASALAAAEPEAPAETPTEPVVAAEAAESAELAESAAPAPEKAEEVAAAEPEVPSSPASALAAAEPEEQPADVVLSLEPTSPRPPLAEIPLAAPESSIAASAGAANAGAATAGAASAAGKVAPVAAEPLAAQPVVPAKSPTPNAVQPAATARGSHPAQDPAGVPRIEALAKGSYYVQIGVFATDEALKASVAALSSGKYPIAYERLEGRGPGSQYRLYVGPIARDESGLTLKKIKAMGYRDAFLKKGK